ncbi:uncharacterized protein IL334_000321 [Kwoniella shivajii]|uniref:Uncharacterized protein n=1 Tax=Kwoniella shivajii TaxID=564305 RepID=A0ABZ1CNU4_9TREE|nr:hypothetical protein IL334_000321 [Kwoniella shivajii]
MDVESASSSLIEESESISSPSIGKTTETKSIVVQKQNPPSSLTALIPMLYPMAVLGFIFSLSSQSKLSGMRSELDHVKGLLAVLQQQVQELQGNSNS